MSSRTAYKLQLEEICFLFHLFPGRVCIEQGCVNIGVACLISYLIDAIADLKSLGAKKVPECVGGDVVGVGTFIVNDRLCLSQIRKRLWPSTMTISSLTMMGA